MTGVDMSCELSKLVDNAMDWWRSLEAAVLCDSVGTSDLVCEPLYLACPHHFTRNLASTLSVLRTKIHYLVIITDCLAGIIANTMESWNNALVIS